MRVIQTLTVLACLSVCVFSNSSTERGFGCPNDNPFIKDFNFEKKDLMKTTVRLRSVCGFELAKYGSCCTESSLLRLADLDSKTVLGDAQIMSEEYKKYQDTLLQLQNVLKNLANSTSPPYHTLRKNIIEDAKARLQEPKVKEFFAQYLVTPEHVKKFTLESANCWQTQAKVRQLAHCYSCSGRSSHFFSENKALISQDTCDAFVRDCRSPVGNLVKMIESFRELPFFAHLLRTMGIDLNFKQKIDQEAYMRYFNSVNRLNITGIIQDATDSDQPEARARFCSKFLRLGEKPIVSGIKSLFRPGSEWQINFDSIKAHFPEIFNPNNTQKRESKFAQKLATTSSSQPNSSSNWRLSRLLQFNGQTNDLLVSDAKIINPTDPSYSSVGVTGHSPMEFGHQFP